MYLKKCKSCHICVLQNIKKIFWRMFMLLFSMQLIYPIKTIALENQIGWPLLSLWKSFTFLRLYDCCLGLWSGEKSGFDDPHHHWHGGRAHHQAGIQSRSGGCQPSMWRGVVLPHGLPRLPQWYLLTHRQNKSKTARSSPFFFQAHRQTTGIWIIFKWTSAIPRLQKGVPLITF